MASQWIVSVGVVVLAKMVQELLNKIQLNEKMSVSKCKTTGVASLSPSGAKKRF
jgi:hypothetical protein